MIKVSPQPESSDFDTKVRKPGLAFLEERGIVEGTAAPPNFVWKELWQHALEDLYDDYRCICAYSCIRLEFAQGGVTVDHYIPKQKHPHLAYEWSNYRLVSAMMNSRKGVHEDVLDPFNVEDGWFVIDFVTGRISPAKGLDATITLKVKATIKRLKLNELRLKKRRWKLFQDYQGGKFTLEFLRDEAPLVYFEVVRQRLTL